MGISDSDSDIESVQIITGCKKAYVLKDGN